jgi:MFS family permease
MSEAINAIAAEASEIDRPIARYSLRYSWYVSIVLTIVYAINLADRCVVAAIIDPIKAEFAFSDTQMGLLTGLAFALGFTAFSFPIAYVADRWNRRNLVCLSVVMFSTMTAVTGLAKSYFQLLVSRIGVGLGESGATPCSLALISDYFPFHKRFMAMAVFTTGSSFGAWYGFTGGGYLADHYGWRNTLFFMSIPGLIMAIWVWITVKEPLRGAFERARVKPGETGYGFVDSLKFLWSQRAFRHVMFAMMLNHSFCYAHDIWSISFFARSHHMSLSEGGSVIGVWYAMVGGVPGALIGGLLAQRLGYRDLRWHSWIAALAVGCGFLPALAAFVLPVGVVFYLANILTGVAMYAFMGPVAAMTQSLVLPQMRALAGAMFLFSTGFVGQIVGPSLVGVLSDLLRTETSLGSESLRWALVASTLLMPWSALHFLIAGRTLRGDYARAGQET